MKKYCSRCGSFITYLPLETAGSEFGKWAGRYLCLDCKEKVRIEIHNKKYEESWNKYREEEEYRIKRQCGEI